MDRGEVARCDICQQLYCRDDCSASMCWSCARLLAGHAGRPLTSAEIALLRAARPWIRRGLVVESSAFLRIHARSSLLGLHRQSKLLVLRSLEDATSRGEAVVEHDVAAPLVRRAEARLKEMRPSVAHTSR